MKNKTKWGGLMSASMLALAACGGATPAANSEPIRVGAVADLTGGTSDIGVFADRGIKAYVAWKNSTGGINGRKIELLTADYEYKVPKAEELYSKFVSQDKAIMFIGWGTGDTEALRPKIKADKIPFVSASFAATLNDQNEAPFNFLVAATYSDQLVIAQQYVIDEAKKAGQDAGKLKFAYLVNNSPFGQSPVAAGKDNAKANGVGEPLVVPSLGAAADHTPQLTQIKDFGATHIFYQNVPSPVARSLKDAKTLGLKAQMVCLNYCSHELLIKLQPEAAEGTLGVIPFNAAADGAKVALEWAAKNNIDIANGQSGYVQGWWTAAILLQGAEDTLKANKPLTGDNMKASLEALKNFQTGGVTGPLNFSATDHRATRSAQMYQVKGGKWTAVTGVLTAK